MFSPKKVSNYPPPSVNNWAPELCLKPYHGMYQQQYGGREHGFLLAIQTVPLRAAPQQAVGVSEQSDASLTRCSSREGVAVFQLRSLKRTIES